MEILVTATTSIFCCIYGTGTGTLGNTARLHCSLILVISRSSNNKQILGEA